MELTAPEQADLTSWLNETDHTILDVVASVAAVVKTPLTIAVTARYFASTVDGTTLANNIRQAIYQWIDRSSVLGGTIRKRSLEAAARVSGVEFVDATIPVNDEYVATAGQVYTFMKTDAVDGVVITVTAL